MFVFAPGAGCSGVPKLVQPGDELVFSGKSEENDWKNERYCQDVSKVEGKLPDESDSVVVSKK